jgi:hypothetical protein
MQHPEDNTQLLDLPGQLLDTVIETLAKVGIELPALLLQLALLTFVLLGLCLALRQLLPNWHHPKPLSVLVASALAILVIGIGFGIVDQALLPDRVAGQVVGPNLVGLQVELLDFRGQQMSTGGGSVDTTSGEFVVYYSPVWNGRPRQLQITSSACQTQAYAMPVGVLRAGNSRSWDFPCRKP